MKRIFLKQFTKYNILQKKLLGMYVGRSFWTPGTSLEQLWMSLLKMLYAKYQCIWFH